MRFYGFMAYFKCATFAMSIVCIERADVCACFRQSTYTGSKRSRPLMIRQHNKHIYYAFFFLCARGSAFQTNVVSSAIPDRHQRHEL